MRFSLGPTLLGPAVAFFGLLSAPMAPGNLPGVKVVLDVSRPDVMHGVAWSQNGSMLAAYSRLGNNITVWDSAGRIMQEMHRPGAPYGGTSLAFVADGQELATPPASYEPGGVVLSIWNVRTGAIARNVPRPHPGESWRDNAGYKFVLSPDRSIFAVIYWPARAQPVALYSTRTWEVIGSLPESTYGRGNIPPLSLAFSPDGKLIAVGEVGGLVKIYDVATRTLVRRVAAYDPSSTRDAETISFSPDSRMIVTGTSFGSSIYDPALVLRCI